MLFLVHNCSLNERIPLAPLALFVLSITHTQHETTPKWLDHNKTRLAPQSTASLGIPPPPLGYTTSTPIQGFTGTAGGHNHPHLKGDEETAHCTQRRQRSRAVSGQPGEQILLLGSTKAPAGKQSQPGRF